MVKQKREIDHFDNIDNVDDFNIIPTIVDIDSAPAGVNFSDCAVNSEGQCCVDFVSDVKSWTDLLQDATTNQSCV